MRRTLMRSVVRFAIAIAVVLAFGGLFKLYTDSQLSEAQQNEVLIKAIPFVAVFASIVLAFIMIVVLVAMTFGGRVPQRAYRPIEMIIIIGILAGVVGLFQGWKLFAYQLGFLLLLVSVLGFMVWSHLTPMSPRASRTLLRLSRRAHLAGLLAAVIAGGVVMATAADAANPQEPYGFGKTLWEFKSAEEQAQVAAEAEDEYRTARLPVLFLVSLLPAGLFYFGVRELFASQPHPAAPERKEQGPLPPDIEDVVARAQPT